MKKLTSICISLILVFASAVLCYGDGLYEVDAQSGQIVRAQYGGDEEEIEYVRLSPNCAYDKTAKMYVYTGMGSSGTTFTSSVYNGMYTRDAVRLQSDPTAQLSVFRSGEQLEYTGDSEFTASGSYIVRDRDNSMVLAFSILDPITGSISCYDVPGIFLVDAVTVNGEELRSLGNSVRMEEDGDYYIHYICYETGANCKLNVTIDHTAPVFDIQGLDENGYAHNAVTLGAAEKYSTVTVVKDGTEIDFAEVLTEPGNYNIDYTDEAGNTSSYSFTIKQYLDVNAWIALLLVVILLIGTAAFMIYTRTHMRVR